VWQIVEHFLLSQHITSSMIEPNEIGYLLDLWVKKDIGKRGKAFFELKLSIVKPIVKA